MTVTPGDQIDFVELPGRRSGDPLRSVDSDSSLRIVRLTGGTQRFAHRHPHSEEIIYVRTGSGTVFIDGVRTAVAAGDTVRIPPDAAHATVPDPGQSMDLVCFFPHPQLADNIEETTIDVMTEGEQ